MSDHGVLLIDGCADAFTSRTRRRGAELLAQGQVLPDVARGPVAIVEVRDARSEPYRVAIDFSELEARDRLGVRCQCAGFGRGQFCEHVFGALLAVASVRTERPSRAVDVVSLRDELPLGEDDFFEASTERPWRLRIEALTRLATKTSMRQPEPALEDLRFVLDLAASEAAGAPVVAALQVRPLREPTAIALEWSDVFRVPPELRPGVELWLACPPPAEGLSGRRILPGIQRALFSALCGHLRLHPRGPPLRFEEGVPWVPILRFERSDQRTRISVRLRRNDDDLPLSEASAILPEGWMIVADHVEAIDLDRAAAWMRDERRSGPLVVSDVPPAELFEALARLPSLPPIEFAAPIDGFRVEARPPVPVLRGGPEDLRSRAELRISFLYGAHEADPDRGPALWVDHEHLTVIPRHFEAEARWLSRLVAAGADPAGETLSVASAARRQLEDLVLREGGEAERAGVRLLRGLVGPMDVRPGGDGGFLLKGAVAFGDSTVSVAAAVRAAATGSRVPLPTGADGILGENDERRLRALGALARISGDELQFGSTQAFLFQRLLDGYSVRADPSFERGALAAEAALQISPVPPPPSFRGELRLYQQVGLGWMQALERLELGGCLADDMGLGKTVQVLALLADGGGPTLVVAPRSLLFSWQEEAERFAPGLRVRAYHGPERVSVLEDLGPGDLVITTYGTVRRDADKLAEVAFFRVILDEAHLIKNPSARGTKAVRRLRARHRLALTGTPVENRPGELWSIFEFLNPRLLGECRAFERLAGGDALPLVARGVAPLLLRRRKGQVLTELPEKTERIVMCEPSPEERSFYEALRLRLAGGLSNAGTVTKAAALEALLRLRQAACHPALLDPSWRGRSSAKLDALLDQLIELREEDHKALVFSQFVRLLELVRERLDQRGVRYAWLDGKTQDREGAVRSFQSDPDCTVFLISLRAGGFGLNLTAADYVFLLDPWWNPAVEAQAVDRAHRLGQVRPVFAYRYLTRGTVEERVLALQGEKRAMAAALLDGAAPADAKWSLEELLDLILPGAELSNEVQKPAR